jgi:hypothetical protein
MPTQTTAILFMSMYRCSRRKRALMGLPRCRFAVRIIIYVGDHGHSIRSAISRVQPWTVLRTPGTAALDNLENDAAAALIIQQESSMREGRVIFGLSLLTPTPTLSEVGE